MVESEARELTEDQMLARGTVRPPVKCRWSSRRSTNWLPKPASPALGVEAAAVDQDLLAAVESQAKTELGEAYRITDKAARPPGASAIRTACVEALAGGRSSAGRQGRFQERRPKPGAQAHPAGEARIDGRDNRTVRPIAREVDLLAKVHGSALFTRGETRLLALLPRLYLRCTDYRRPWRARDPFMLHYNFLPTR